MLQGTAVALHPDFDPAAVNDEDGEGANQRHLLLFALVMYMAMDHLDCC